MSIFPCDVCGRRVPGSLGSAYLSVMPGPAIYRRKLRMCAPHISEFLDTTGKSWQQVSDEGLESLPVVCSACTEVIGDEETPVPVFATVFPKRDQRIDYYGGLHSRCVDGYCSALELFSV